MIGVSISSCTAARNILIVRFTCDDIVNSPSMLAPNSRTDVTGAIVAPARRKDDVSIRWRCCGVEHHMNSVLVGLSFSLFEDIQLLTSSMHRSIVAFKAPASLG